MDSRDPRDTNPGLPRPHNFQKDSKRNSGSNFRTRPCKQWQKGNCKKGDKCTFLHSNGSSAEGRRTTQNPPAASSAPISVSQGTNDPHRSPGQKQTPTRICIMFITRRWCNYGDSCKFSHDPNFKSDPLQMEATQPLDDLKMILRTFERTKQFRFIAQFEKFVETSLKALELPDRDLQSKSILCLSEYENGGREVVRYVAEAMGNQSPPFADIAFDKHVVPFMKLIVHDVFTRTCIEKNLLYLIKALYGDGKRGDRLLTRIIDLLEPIIESTTNIENGSVQEHCFLVCTLLHHIVQYNADAISQPELIIHHARLLMLSNNIRTTNPNTRKIEKSLSEISAYLFPGVTTDKVESTHKAPSITAPGQELPVDFVLDLPGQLSRSGTRHDNDSHLITDIRILPTMDEFKSNRPEYLPINDMRASHFLEGPTRLFDIHFRHVGLRIPSFRHASIIIVTLR
jgi:Zinc finger domain/Zinc finger C-x8-C-x5-C-x3-H type (and similar)